MKIRTLSLVMLLLMFACSSGNRNMKKISSGLMAGATQYRGAAVAVLPFIVEGGPEIEGRVIAEKLTEELLASGGFLLVERSRIEALIKEQGLGQSGMVELKAAVELGKVLAARAIVIGTVYYRPDGNEVYARLVDTASGLIISSGNAVVPHHVVVETRGRVQPKTRVSYLPVKDKGVSGFAGKSGAIADDKKPQAKLVQVQTVSSYGSVYFIGLVSNTGEAAIKTPHIVVKLKNAAGMQLTLVDCFASRDVLPGETVPFEGIALNQKGKYASYEVLYEPEKLEYQTFLYNLKSTQENLTRGSYGDMSLSGIIINNTGESVKYAKAVASFYDGAGKFIGSGIGFSTGKILKPGDQSPYKIYLQSSKLNGVPKRYTLLYSAMHAR